MGQPPSNWRTRPGVAADDVHDDALAQGAVYLIRNKRRVEHVHHAEAGLRALLLRQGVGLAFGEHALATLEDRGHLVGLQASDAAEW
jgi:hypothetical protein